MHECLNLAGMIRHLTAALAGEPFLAMRYTFGRLKVYHNVYAGPDALQPEQTLGSRLGNSDEILTDRRTTWSGLADPPESHLERLRMGLCQSLGRSALEPADYRGLRLAIAFAHAKSQLPCHGQASLRAVACVRHNRRLYAYRFFTLGAYLGGKHARRYNAMDRICLQRN